jgi:hypothetical protein
MKIQFLAIILTASIAFSQSYAYDKMVFAGGEVSGNNGRYGGIGIIGALPGDNTLGNGFVYRVLGEGLGYSYKSGTREIDGTAFGGDITFGYQKSYTDKSWWAAYAGPSYRHTNLSPNDPTNDSSGGQFGARVQLEGDAYFTPDFKFNASGSYGFGYNTWWTRARLLYAPMGTFFAGPEFVYQGDEEFTEYSIGAVVNTLIIEEGTDIGFKGGYRKNEDLNGTAYGGIEMSHSF